MFIQDTTAATAGDSTLLSWDAIFTVFLAPWG